MKLYTSLLLFSLCAGCSAQTNTEKALQLRTVMPLHDPSFDPFEFKRNITLVERDSLNIFKLPHIHQEIENSPDGNGDYISRLIRKDTFYYYVMYKQGQRFGFTDDSARGTAWRKISVDSFLSSASIYSLDTLVNMIGKNDSLVTSVISKDGSMVTERYIVKTKPDSTHNDTTVVIFNRDLNRYRFSFSRRADKNKKRKLCYIELIYAPDPGAKYAFLRNRRSILFEIRETELPDPELYDKLEKIYKDLSKKSSVQ